ncbi:dihydropteroate synthase [Shewanella sp. Scap07]|uniref:dihydropteroate synthase n=1 Tax=Shewanella sp. Scap07 TaxID=2589987 RepID=UPI0015BDAC47|nr:dihydropteroate synthase [Shewanella sp. Scap07]QLE87865.1 dihydropteroate synthase [Shewanella sp. Scap07]
MGILNVTPDSFSDGGQYSSYEIACRHADEMVRDGATIIDIGGESTRPGAAPVSLNDELLRVIPLVEYVAKHHDVWISIDTSKPEVMQQAVNAGADLINDVCALSQPGALAMAAQLDVPVCLMHMQGKPQTMQNQPEYQDVVDDIVAFFTQRIDDALKAGIKRENILIDPGFGFGKTLAHNYQLLAELHRFKTLSIPLLIGLSRKSMIGNLLGCDVLERDNGSAVAAMLAVQNGADIVRVHNVKLTVEMLRVLDATNNYAALST